MNRPPCNSKAKPGRLEGEVIAFATGFGKIRWRTRIGPTESSPLLADGRVYVGDWRGRVYALDEQTGRVHWTFQGKGRIKGAIAKSGNRLFVGTYDGYLYAIRASTGKVIWRTRSQDRLGGRGQFYSTPAVAYGRVYIGSTDGKVYSFGAASGKLRWSQGTGGYVYGSPAVWRKTVYVGSYSGRFYALDAATGDVKWRFRAQGDISGSATVLNGVVYFSTFDELHIRARRAHRQAALDVQGRQVRRCRRRRRPPLPRRPRARLWDGRAVRYVVTGAAGFIGSHLAEALLAAGHEVLGIDSFTDYYDPALKERNAAALDVRALDLAARRARPRGLRTASSISPGSRGCASFGDVFPLYVARNVLASQRVFEAAAAAGVARRLRVLVVGLRRGGALPDARGRRRRGRSRPTGSRSSPASISRAPRARASGSMPSCCATSTPTGPRQRPDMAFPRIVEALLEGRPFTLFGDGEQSRSFTYVGDVVDASMLAMERGRSGRGLQRRRRPGGDDERDDRDARADLRAPRSTSSGRGRRRATSGGRRPTRRGSASELGWQPSTSLEEGLRAQWEWAAVESPA